MYTHFFYCNVIRIYAFLWRLSKQFNDLRKNLWNTRKNSYEYELDVSEWIYVSSLMPCFALQCCISSKPTSIPKSHIATSTFSHTLKSAHKNLQQSTSFAAVAFFSYCCSLFVEPLLYMILILKVKHCEWALFMALFVHCKNCCVYSACMQILGSAFR